MQSKAYQLDLDTIIVDTFVPETDPMVGNPLAIIANNRYETGCVSGCDGGFCGAL